MKKILSVLFVLFITNSCVQEESNISPNDINVGEIIVNESDKTVTFTATLKNKKKGGLSVDFATVDGTATAPENYIAKNGSVHFKGDAGEQKSVTLELVDDDILEPTEVFEVLITNMTSGFETAQKTVEIQIIDDDASETGSVSISDIEVHENEGIANFTVVLSHAIQGGLTVDYESHDNSAVASSDYDALSGILTFEGVANKHKQ